MPARLSAPAAEARRGENPLAVELPALVDLDVDVVPHLDDAAPAPRQAIQAGPAGGRGPVRDHVLELGVRPLRRAEVAMRVGSVDRAHEVRRACHGAISW